MIYHSGWVYILKNKAFGTLLIKIGEAKDYDLIIRVGGLDNTSLPFPFEVLRAIWVISSFEIEHDLHRIFKDIRVSNGKDRKREFFQFTPGSFDQLMAIMDSYVRMGAIEWDPKKNYMPSDLPGNHYISEHNKKMQLIEATSKALSAEVQKLAQGSTRERVQEDEEEEQIIQMTCASPPTACASETLLHSYETLSASSLRRGRPGFRLESFEQLSVAANQKAPRVEPVRQDRTQYSFESCIDCSKVSKFIDDVHLHLETGEVVPLELIPIGDGKFKNVKTQEVFNGPAEAAKNHSTQMAYNKAYEEKVFHTLKQRDNNVKKPHGKTYPTYEWQYYWKYVDLDGHTKPINEIIIKKPIIPRPRGAKKIAV